MTAIGTECAAGWRPGAAGSCGDLLEFRETRSRRRIADVGGSDAAGHDAFEKRVNGREVRVPPRRAPRGRRGAGGAGGGGGIGVVQHGACATPRRPADRGSRAPRRPPRRSAGRSEQSAGTPSGQRLRQRQAIAFREEGQERAGRGSRRGGKRPRRRPACRIRAPVRAGRRSGPGGRGRSRSPIRGGRSATDGAPHRRGAPQGRARGATGAGGSCAARWCRGRRNRVRSTRAAPRGACRRRRPSGAMATAGTGRPRAANSARKLAAVAASSPRRRRPSRQRWQRAARWRRTCGGRAYSGWLSGIRSWMKGTKAAPARRSGAMAAA